MKEFETLKIETSNEIMGGTTATKDTAYTTNYETRNNNGSSTSDTTTDHQLDYEPDIDNVRVDDAYKKYLEGQLKP